MHAGTLAYTLGCMVPVMIGQLAVRYMFAFLEACSARTARREIKGVTASVSGE